MNNYILISAAKNEQDYIGKTIESVIRQNIKPILWCIVSDGSTDKTDEIIQEYSKTNLFIKYIRNDKTDDRNFASKVYALNIALKYISEIKIDYDFIGNLDADTVFDSDYYSKILKNSKTKNLVWRAEYSLKHIKVKIKVVLASNSVRGAVQFLEENALKKLAVLFH